MPLGSKRNILIVININKIIKEFSFKKVKKKLYVKRKCFVFEKYLIIIVLFFLWNILIYHIYIYLRFTKILIMFIGSGHKIILIETEKHYIVSSDPIHVTSASDIEYLFW